MYETVPADKSNWTGEVSDSFISITVFSIGLTLISEFFEILDFGLVDGLLLDIFFFSTVFWFVDSLVSNGIIDSLLDCNWDGT